MAVIAPGRRVDLAQTADDEGRKEDAVTERGLANAVRFDMVLVCVWSGTGFRTRRWSGEAEIGLDLGM